jgi:hypothetical protein
MVLCPSWLRYISCVVAAGKDVGICSRDDNRQHALNNSTGTEYLVSHPVLRYAQGYHFIGPTRQPFTGLVALSSPLHVTGSHYPEVQGHVAISPLNLLSHP